ncbi:uncharacterized protein LOC119720847 [Patiria miniata]|uniref:Mitochondria-eating protein n=1 Tax=Patiria miniata TaxID=46514 RepID=A0A913Z4I4_PATMI|nr:uncharacterized protein LOC119720847 [Patiria miniata]
MSSAKHDDVSRPKKGRSKKSQVPLPGPWRNSSWVNSFGGKGASPLKYQEVSPSFILRQLLLLVEKGKFVDASQLVNKISMDSLKDIVMDIPMEMVIERIPQSLIVLESLYSRLFISDADSFPIEQFQVEVMVFHVVRYLSMLESGVGFKHPKPEDAKKSIMNILRIVLNVNPDLIRTLYKRKKLMDTALQGIGEHGLIEVKGSLITLHDALKLEIGRNITAYKGAVNTLEHLNLSKSKSVSLKVNGDKKSGHNHQALTKLNENQVKNRLFKNKALLNAIESHINTQLPALVSTLKDRIEYDKSALLAFGKLKSEIKTFSSHTKVVPLLAQYSKSLRSVLDMFKELLDEHCLSDKSSYSTLGYHSDEEDMLSVQEASEDSTSQEAVVQPETDESDMQEVPSTIAQILNPPADESSHDKLSLPGEEIPDKRSRWWKSHRRSHSLEIGGSSRNGNRQSVVISEPVGRPRSRTSSVDRGSISRPRRDSVEESQEFKTMMTRIREMSGSSPAIGRRQLERRGISQPRSRDSSISPAALRRHFFGGGGSGEQTPSISSQTESKDDPDVIYASIKPKGQRSQASDKEIKAESKDDPEVIYATIKSRGQRSQTSDKEIKAESKDDPEVIYASIKPRGQRSQASDKEILKAGPSLAQKLEDALRDRDRLAESEKKLKRENEQLKETLRLITMEMESMNGRETESANEEVFSPGPAAQEGPTVFSQRTSESKEEPPLQSSAKESSVPTDGGSSISDQVLTTFPEPIPAPQQFSNPEPTVTPSPTSKGAAVPPVSPVSQESPMSPLTPISPLEPVSPSSSSKENALPPGSKKTASFVEKQKAILREQAERLKQSSFKAQVPLEELPESSVRQQRASIELKLKAELETSPPPVKRPSNPVLKPDLPGPEPPEPQVPSLEQQEGSEQAKPAEQSQDTAVQENNQQSSPSSQDQKPPAEPSQPNDEPPEEPVEKQETPTEQKPPMDHQESKPSTDLQEQAKPPTQTNHQPKPASPKKAKSATFSAQLHLRPIPESSSPTTQPKASSLKEVPDNRLSKNGEVKKQKKSYTHTNRHLPKNLIRHVTGDLLYHYDKLYSEQRAVAWTCLTIPPEDKDALLFSVIVFAFQSAQTTVHELHMARARMLLIPATDDEESVSSYTMDIPPDNRSQVELLEHLRKMGDSFDLTPMITDVMEQLFEITEHVDILQISAAFKKFVTSCVSLAWRLSIQSAPYVIDFELRSFDPALHQRVPGSNRKSARVKEHIWPALLESTKGMCVYRGVVLT